MAGALRLVSVQRGHDPRDFALVAYGGAGPLHANAVAKLMGSFPVIVPPAPGLLCAIGDLVADFRDEFAQTYIRLVGQASGGEVADILDDLGARAQEWLEGEGIDESARRITYVADMRYHRQGYEIPVALDPDEVRADGLADLEERFNAPARAAVRVPDAGNRVGDRQPPRGRVRRGAEAGAAAPGRCRAADASGAVVDEHEVVFDGERVRDEDLRPGEARAGRRDRRPGDRDRVRLDHRRPARLTRPKVDTNFNILITPSA